MTHICQKDFGSPKKLIPNYMYYKLIINRNTKKYACTCLEISYRIAVFLRVDLIFAHARKCIN